MARPGKARQEHGEGTNGAMVAYPRFKTGHGKASQGGVWHELGEGTNGAWWRYAICG